MSSIEQHVDNKSIFIWNIVGSMANALFSVLILLIVARGVSEKQADIFSLAWSVSQLMLIIGTFQIRTYQATDVEGKYTFRQYFYFRIITIILMMGVSFIYIVVKKYDVYKSTIILIMCMVRAVEAMSDMYEGWFQQKERLDLSGKVIAYRVVVSCVVFFLTLMISKNLLFASICLLVSYVITFIIYNLRYSTQVEGIAGYLIFPKKCKWVISIFSEGMPVFVNAFLMMSIMNGPKMSIDAAISQGILGDGVQTVYNILFLPASFINLAYIVFRPLITKMAICWNGGRRKELFSILMKIELSLIGIGCVLVIGGKLFGISLLSAFYGIELSSYRMELLVIIAGGCFYTFASVFDNALVAMRKHRILVIAYILSWIYTQVIMKKMVFVYGVQGAALTYATAMLVFLIVAMILFTIYYVKIVNEEKRGNNK